MQPKVAKNTGIITATTIMRTVISPCVVLLVGEVVALLLASNGPVGGEVCGRVGGEEEVGGSVGGEEGVGGSVGGEEGVGGSVSGEEVMGSVLSGVGNVPDELVLLGAGVVLTAGWLLKKATCGLSRILRTAPRHWMGSDVV